VIVIVPCGCLFKTLRSDWGKLPDQTTTHSHTGSCVLCGWSGEMGRDRMHGLQHSPRKEAYITIRNTTRECGVLLYRTGEIVRGFCESALPSLLQLHRHPTSHGQ
jgi:hypothetical protein